MTFKNASIVVMALLSPLVVFMAFTGFDGSPLSIVIALMAAFIGIISMWELARLFRR